MLNGFNIIGLFTFSVKISSVFTRDYYSFVIYFKENSRKMCCLVTMGKEA